MTEDVNPSEPPSKKNHQTKTTSSKSWIGRLLSFDDKDDEDSRFESEILKQRLKQAAEQEKLAPDTSLMMIGALNASDTTAEDIMIPRAKVVALNINWPFSRILSVVIESGHSRFPVLGENDEDLRGILLVKDLLPFFSQTEVDIIPLLRNAQFVPEGKGVTALLRDFRANRSHIALVVNEYGEVSGLVTIEDVLELIVGNISDEHDKEEEIQIKKLNDHEYIVNAVVSVEAFNEYFNTQFSDEEVDTIGGVLLTQLGYLPKNNEIIEIDSFQFKVLPFDGKRLNLLEVTLVSQDAAEEDNNEVSD